LLEQEKIPGAHASGKNASLVLQSVEHARVREIVAASRKAYSRHREEVGFTEVGSIQLGSPSQLEKLRDPDHVESFVLDPADARKKVPLLANHRFQAALWTPSDGVMDISHLLYFFLDGARLNGDFEMRLDCRVTGFEKKDGGCIVKTVQGPVECGLVVNAAGAWAPGLAEDAGIEPLPMTSFKRHLFILEGISGIDPASPFTWSIAENFYFRPESGGIMFSICDEESAGRDFTPTVNPEVELQLAELVETRLPAFSGAVQRQVWSCFRTKTPHGGFYIEWSRSFPEMLWVAGLGGHGMGAAWEVGRLAAEKILERI